MKVVTITREYGAGGGEVAQRLADALGWEVLDRELLHQAAEIEHVPDAELERLDEKAVSMADRFRLHPPHQKYLHGLSEAAHQAAQRGHVVLVGAARGICWARCPIRSTCVWSRRASGVRSGWRGSKVGRWTRPGPVPRNGSHARAFYAIFFR